MTFIEHLLCATYCANAFTNSISVKLQNNPFYNPHFIEEGEVFKKVNNLPEVSQLVNADPKFETLYFWLKNLYSTEYTEIPFPIRVKSWGIFFVFIFVRIFNIAYFCICDVEV